MRVTNQDQLLFPAGFNRVLSRSFQTYLSFFLSYFILAAITYLPFLIITEVSSLDLMDLVEFFHGNFLDIIVFLTLPTLITNSQVYPLATISLFMQRFFASAVIISFVQFGTLLFFITFLAQISIAAIMIGVIPYVFLLFAGFFLIMENAEKLIAVRTNLIKSISLVRGQFFPIFLNYMGITLLVILPLMAFSLWYLSTNPGVMAFRESLDKSSEIDNVAFRQFFIQVADSVQADSFRWTRIGIHVLFRPIKSLFLAYLFLGIIQRVSPHTVLNYLGQDKPSNHSRPGKSDPKSGDSEPEETI